VPSCHDLWPKLDWRKRGGGSALKELLPPHFCRAQSLHISHPSILCSTALYPTQLNSSLRGHPRSSRPGFLIRSLVNPPFLSSHLQGTAFQHISECFYYQPSYLCEQSIFTNPHRKYVFLLAEAEHLTPKHDFIGGISKASEPSWGSFVLHPSILGQVLALSCLWFQKRLTYWRKVSKCFSLCSPDMDVYSLLNVFPRGRGRDFLGNILVL
jgi:hypothetical protein